MLYTKYYLFTSLLLCLGSSASSGPSHGEQAQITPLGNALIYMYIHCTLRASTQHVSVGTTAFMCTVECH